MRGRNDPDLVIPLSANASGILRDYLKTIRPLAFPKCAEDEDGLSRGGEEPLPVPVPGRRKGGSRLEPVICRLLDRLMRAVHAQVGVRINPHLYRHLIGWIGSVRTSTSCRRSPSCSATGRSRPRCATTPKSTIRSPCRNGRTFWRRNVKNALQRRLADGLAASGSEAHRRLRLDRALSDYLTWSGSEACPSSAVAAAYLADLHDRHARKSAESFFATFQLAAGYAWGARQARHLAITLRDARVTDKPARKTAAARLGALAETLPLAFQPAFRQVAAVNLAGAKAPPGVPHLSAARIEALMRGLARWCAFRPPQDVRPDGPDSWLTPLCSKKKATPRSRSWPISSGFYSGYAVAFPEFASMSCRLVIDDWAARADAKRPAASRQSARSGRRPSRRSATTSSRRPAWRPSSASTPRATSGTASCLWSASASRSAPGRCRGSPSTRRFFGRRLHDPDLSTGRGDQAAGGQEATSRSSETRRCGARSTSTAQSIDRSTIGETSSSRRSSRGPRASPRNSLGRYAETSRSGISGSGFRSTICAITWPPRPPRRWRTAARLRRGSSCTRNPARRRRTMIMLRTSGSPGSSAISLRRNGGPVRS